ncbi:MAG: haloacid dehalogenase type II [Pseudomonadota bacterium]
MPITTVIFDAYGTLFDIAAAARRVAAEGSFPALKDLWQDLASDWRNKQLEYSWLRAVTGDHTDFWQVTQDALDWTMERHGLSDPALRDELLDLYRQLDAYPDARSCLEALRTQGIGIGILSNGSPAMIATACDAGGLNGLIDKILSVETVGVFKPSPKVYNLVETKFSVSRDSVLFASSNGWDASCAAAYGFVSVWVNRNGLPLDRLPGRPAHILKDLADVPNLI